ncbi:EpsG family protein [Psychrobacter sanguinis]|uniref:EpsG family protein n=1 Tax=Psychrobacter sanguinis TaxID=861445 RepID=UPI0028A27F85|nr:EpsG family protein [Psychrobacter sanguinis]
MNSIFIVFIILLCLSLIELLNKNTNVKTFIWVLASTLILFLLGLGYKVGVDWVSYKDNYSNYYSGFEPLYNILANFFANINVNFWVFAIFLKCIHILLLLKIFRKYTKLPILAAVIFFSLTYPYINDVLRQIVASIVILSSFLIYKKYPSLVSIIFASGFHASSLVLVVGKLKFFSVTSNRFIITLVIGCLIAGLSLKGILTSSILGSLSYTSINKLQFYSEGSNLSNLYSSIVRFSIFSLALYFQAKVSRSESSINDWIYKATLLMLLIEALTLSIPLISQRIRMYLLPFVCIALTNGIYNSRKHFKLIVTTYTLTYCMLFIYLFTHGSFKDYYQLDMNIIMQFIKGFPPNNWESLAYDFWLYG